ncbi:lipopolysaccharide-induced tumor necrosis factor-alpha factor homolog [Thrips palmi]|uniref:Lipopolysaccharide-induced tumor necrosis factor-alpha factor homolog n=1 Tax=Thrips palmi TaxID=161013 RepID=A0A6P8ZZT1_THRPL|nr:lipopolysaccharide-induced tumor necrosis factor-alpha factor homolog [Thrips palmi]
MIPSLGSEPVQITCPHCNNYVVTKVDYQANNSTHIKALLLCLLCGCLPGLIPYCCNSCQSAVHTCPVCHKHVGTDDN